MHSIKNLVTQKKIVNFCDKIGTVMNVLSFFCFFLSQHSEMFQIFTVRTKVLSTWCRIKLEKRQGAWNMTDMNLFYAGWLWELNSLRYCQQKTLYCEMGGKFMSEVIYLI